jgi:hypothetical protein
MASPFLPTPSLAILALTLFVFAPHPLLLASGLALNIYLFNGPPAPS